MLSAWPHVQETADSGRWLQLFLSGCPASLAGASLAVLSNLTSLASGLHRISRLIVVLRSLSINSIKLCVAILETRGS